MKGPRVTYLPVRCGWVELSSRTRQRAHDHLSEGRLPASPDTVSRLRHFLRELDIDDHGLDPDATVTKISSLIARGLVYFESIPQNHARTSIGALDRVEPLDDYAAAKSQQHWIEIMLCDEQDRPVSNMKYEVTLPDGSRRRGTTNARGIARIENLSEGDCEITFPDLHEQSWRYRGEV